MAGGWGSLLGCMLVLGVLVAGFETGCGGYPSHRRV